MASRTRLLSILGLSVAINFATITPAIPGGVSAVPSAAFLGVEFLNDNEALEPTSPAERKRIKTIERLLTTKLEEMDLYKFVDVPNSIQKKIKRGQPIGECGGCEIDYGKELDVDRIVWIRVQKISNLILNMNVYVADVASQQMTFVRSVDIRGNTDESWSHSIKWLIRRYMKPDDKD